MKILTLSAGVLLGLFLNSCDPVSSDDLKPKTIYTAYYLAYDQEQDLSTATARFYYKGSLGAWIELKSPSSVKFNDSTLYKDFVYSYSKQFPGLVATGTFVYTDDSSKRYTNHVSITTIQAGAMNTFTKGSSSYYTFSGSGLNVNERANLTIKDTLGNYVFISQSYGDGNKILVPKSQLDSLSAGAGHLQLTRYRSSDLVNAPEAGGTIDAQYVTRWVPCMIK